MKAFENTLELRKKNVSRETFLSTFTSLAEGKLIESVKPVAVRVMMEKRLKRSKVLLMVSVVSK